MTREEVIKLTQEDSFFVPNESDDCGFIVK